MSRVFSDESYTEMKGNHLKSKTYESLQLKFKFLYFAVGSVLFLIAYLISQSNPKAAWLAIIPGVIGAWLFFRALTVKKSEYLEGIISQRKAAINNPPPAPMLYAGSLKRNWVFWFDTVGITLVSLLLYFFVGWFAGLFWYGLHSMIGLTDFTQTFKIENENLTVRSLLRPWRNKSWPLNNFVGYDNRRISHRGSWFGTFSGKRRIILYDRELRSIEIPRHFEHHQVKDWAKKNLKLLD